MIEIQRKQRIISWGFAICHVLSFFLGGGVVKKHHPVGLKMRLNPPVLL